MRPKAKKRPSALLQAATSRLNLCPRNGEYLPVTSHTKNSVRTCLKLVDTRRASLEAAERVLRHYQTWPPRPPADFEELRQRVRERFERSARQEVERTGRGRIGGFLSGSHNTPEGNGSASMTGWEGDTFVKMELHAFKGHKMEFEERFRLSGDQRTIQYSQKVKGPTGTEHCHEMKFDVIEGG